MKLKEITAAIEQFAPLSYQESYDNAGLITGNSEMEITSAIVCVDTTDAVLDEALKQGANLIISHHPIIFHPLKKLTGKNHVERIVIKAIQNGIALYACHTNLDSVTGGVSCRMAEKLGLNDIKILEPRSGNLVKIAVHTPESHTDAVRSAMADAGAGAIGNYDSCSFNVHGEGTFRARSGATPFVGTIGELHREREIRTETIAPRYLAHRIVAAAKSVHPYEEMAFEVIPLDMPHPAVGFGAVGNLPVPENTEIFLKRMKEVFGVGAVRHSRPLTNTVQKIAMCGGSGASMLDVAIAAGADVFLTADVKYDQFFAAEGRILLADIGHFESEYCAIDILYDIVTKNLPNFALHKSEFSRNPIIYLV